MRKYVIPAVSDDGFNYEDTPNNSYLGTANVRFGHRTGAGHGDCTGGFRFLPDIPKTFTILKAVLYMKAYAALSGTMRVKIAADDVDNSPTFNDSDQEPRDRVLTTAKVDWDEVSWPADTWKFSPDIKDVIQEIYDRPGFTPGNGLSIVIINDGSDAGANGQACSRDLGNPAELWIYIAEETTSDDDHATRMAMQRGSFYANGRFWKFYSDGGYYFYRSSTDGVNWTLEESVGTTTWGADDSVWFDGTYVHYVRSVSGGVIYYRRGTPSADGVITWSAAEQNTGSSGYDPTVIVDDQGYPWVFHLRGAYEPWVTKSDTDDGTWHTQAGFAYKLSTDSAGYMRCFGLPLTGGKVFAIWGWRNAQAKGKVWDGSSWDAEETITSSSLYNYAADGPGMSAVNEGDDVHLVFWDTTPDIKYRKRTYGVGWGAEETVQASVATTSEPVLSKDGSDLYCFWASSPVADHIYYKKYSAGWDADPTDWIDETTDDLTSAANLSCYYEKYGNYIGIIYQTRTSSPYLVKHDYLTIAVVAAPTVTTVAADSIEVTTANPKGNVTDNGGENPTRYIDYDTDSGEPYAHSKDCGVGGVGEYDSNLTDLSPGQKYYYRARAVNSGGTGKGDEMTFTTKEGGTEDCGVGGVGPYEKVLSGLTPNTTYRLRARGVNSGGTGTGAEKEFTTLAS